MRFIMPSFEVVYERGRLFGGWWLPFALLVAREAHVSGLRVLRIVRADETVIEGAALEKALS
jgi:hypothetical protein